MTVHGQLFTLPRKSSRSRRRDRREARTHAKRMFAAGCPEKALVWLKRARNG